MKYCDVLKEHYTTSIKPTHLRDLLQDAQRNSQLLFQHNNICLDLSHEKITAETLQHFSKLIAENGLFDKIHALFSGEKINVTENRAVLHPALRSNADQTILFEGKNVVTDVHKVLSRIEDFTKKIHSNEIKGFSGKSLKNYVVIGIGGSYLSIEFVYEAIRSSRPSAAKDGKLKFVANVDPVDFKRAVEGLNAEETLFIINSKTFTTAETMLNAATCRNWLLSQYKSAGVTDQDLAVVNSHMCAVSTNIPETTKFGISEERVFGFWDWVGGRFSVWSAIGVLPLALYFGFDTMKEFLAGGHDIDQSFVNNKEVKDNLALLLGLIGFYNTSIAEYSARAILPYSQALCKFVPHVQQLDMESNGKRVNLQGQIIDYNTTVVNFGEPGTNGQHSFYQLLHQGREIPCEFIGFIKSQANVNLTGTISNHDELMTNFFSQPDALAYGKTEAQLVAEKCPEPLLKHKQFPGNRPSLILLFEQLNAFSCGQLLALYEHRTVVEGFLWNIDSFDQWGVELGKVLAKDVRNFFQESIKTDKNSFENFKFNSATQSLLQRYMEKRESK